MQQGEVEVHFNQTLYLNISIEGLVQGDNIIAFDIFADDSGQLITTSSINGHRIMTVHPEPNNKLGGRFTTQFSQEEQRVTLIIKNMQYEEDGMVLISRLYYIKQGRFVFPAPTNTTIVSVVGKFTLKCVQVLLRNRKSCYIGTLCRL